MSLHPARLIASAFALFVAACGPAPQAGGDPAASAEATVRPVSAPGVAAPLTVVELFNSQGCNACPPANDNLAILSKRPDVLALSFGVTYWDQLGWTDTFASPRYTARQRSYQGPLGNDNVWTPQVVVNGRADVVGQRLPEIERLIRDHPVTAGPRLRLRPDGVTVGQGGPGARPADVWLVRYEPRTIQVAIQRGENGGRTLPHTNVVRDLVRLGGWEGPERSFAIPAPAAGLRTAVLVQGVAGGPILAAAKG